jgi:DNA repair protein RadD
LLAPFALAFLLSPTDSRVKHESAHEEKMQLRDYQQEAVDAVFAYWDRAPSTLERPASPLVVMPTGSGKSPTIGETVRRLVQEMDCRVLVATHRAELIKQDVKAIRSVWLDAPIGIYSASLGRKEIAQITVAGVQSISRQARKLGHIDVMVIDEAHLIPPTSSEHYGKLIEALRKVNPDMRLIGYTATPFRLGQGYLTQGEGAVFTAIAIDVPIRRLIEAGYLAPVVTQFVSAKIDTSKVSKTAGEFNLKELGVVSDTDEINEAVANNVRAAFDAGRTSAIVFAANLEHAARLRNELQMRGVSCEVVEGDTPQETRDAIYTKFKARKLQCICSCEVLTTGFDAPVVDVVALVRATLSPALYVQMVGRETRPIYEDGFDPDADGCTAEQRLASMARGLKPNALLLDYGGNIDRHGPIDEVRVKPKRGTGEAPVKTCEGCLAQCAAGCRVCPHCGKEFPPPEPKSKLEEKASEKAVLSFMARQEPPRKEVVGSVEWSKHFKRVPDGETATPTLRIDYLSPKKGALSYERRVASEWLCFDHDEGSYARKKAERWWDDNVGCRQPESVDDAIALLDFGYMAKVTQVTLVKDGKYDRVTHVLQVRPEQAAAEADDDPPPTTPDPNGWNDDDLPF